MENKEQLNNIPQEMFEFTQLDAKIKDVEFKTKAIGYFGDAFRRFCKNKSSVVAFFILMLLILLAIFVPMFSKYDPLAQNLNEAYLPPRVPLLEKLGIMDGVIELEKKNVNNIKSLSDPEVWTLTDEEFNNLYFIEYIKGYDSIEELLETKYAEEYQGSVSYYVDFEYRIYDRKEGPRWLINQTYKEYKYYKDNNLLFTGSNGELIVNINKNAAGILASRPDLLPEGAIIEEYYTYSMVIDTSSLNKVYHYFGTDDTGRDVWTRLWYGARTSLLIGLFVALVTLTVGVTWGAISGYYGGIIDLIMERFTEILGGIPWIVIMIIVKMLLTQRGVDSKIIVAISLVLTSWIGTASMVRTQMYRYKNREYVLASRTLGANDPRLITKHILPNALGTIVTSSILVIPSAIFFESSVAYLGLGVNSSTLSIGNILNAGRALGIIQYPYLTVFPAIFISLLMISFNMFGNGLRDALNPSLRGSE